MTPTRADSKSFSQLFPQLFLFPLLIVSVGVLVYMFFIASAQDSRSVEEIVDDIESEGPHARKQDLYALAMKVRDLRGPDGKQQYFSEATTKKLLGLLERSQDDDQLREGLVLAIGRAGDPKLTVPVMAEMALGPGMTEEGRAYAVQSLGLSRSPEAAATLIQVLDRYTQPHDWELRWNALGGLANSGTPAAAERLRQALGDPRREVSWSAACWLANLFDDPAGVGTLRHLVDWKFLDQQRGDQNRELHPGQKEQYMLMALEGLYKLEKGDALDLVREKAKDTRSAKVQNAALKILDKENDREKEARSSADDRAESLHVQNV